MSDSNEQYSVIDYNSFGSVLRPFTRNIYDASGNISGVFEQAVDTRKVMDFKKILKKELEENQIEALENLDKQASVIAAHAEEHKKYDSVYKNGTAKIIVTGGKFYGFDPANSNDGSYVAEGYVSTEKTDEQGNTYFEVTAE